MELTKSQTEGETVTPIILPKHVVHPSGKRKTICVTACLTALGIPENKFQTTGSIYNTNYLKILNRHGFSTRSRKSSVEKTVGACRKSIIKLNEQATYFVVVRGSGYCHAILIDNQGKTIVDTAPRKRDKRKIHSIHAVTRL